MNYYEHHIRDYDAATSHLSWDEDLAYTRLIRWYYRKEKPIPADLKEACRQVRAITKLQRDAVESVLKEFFELRDDGWHNDTCDEALERYKDGEPEREVKKANEENRTKRHRDERARLFKILTDAGQHAPWNIGMTELRDIVSRTTVTAPATPIAQPVTQPVTAPATPVTATQSPITNHQSPEYIKPTSLSDQPPVETQPASPVDKFPERHDSENYETQATPSTGSPPESKRNVEIAVLLRAKGVKPMTFAHPQAIEWAGNPAVTDDMLNAAVQTARDYKPVGDISPNYLKPIIEQLLHPPEQKASKPSQDTWWTSNAGIDRKAREMGMSARPTEDYSSFKDRIFEEVRKRGGNAA